MRVVVGAVVLIAVAVASDARAGDSPRAIAAIGNDLVADDPAVRAKAAGELADRFPDGAVAVPMLVDLLDDESPDVAAAAAKAIDSMALASVAPLVKFLDDDKRLHPPARFGESMEVILRLKAPSALDPVDLDELSAGKSPPDVAAMAALIPDHLSNRHATPPLPILLTLYRKAPADQRVLPAAALAQRAADAPSMRRHAPAAGPARAAATAAALPLLRSDSDLRTWIGARLLARIRPADEAVSAELVKAMTTARKPLKTQSGEEIRVARRAAALALSSIGAGAASAAPALLDAAGKDDPDGPRVGDCVAALLAMGREADVVALLDRKPATARDIAFALALQGRAAAKVMPVIIGAIADEGVYGDTVSTLVALGPDATAALPALRDFAAKAEYPNQRLMAADAILALAPGDADALRIVEDLAKEPPGEGAVTPLTVLAERAQPSAALVSRLSAAIAPAAGPAWDYYEVACIEGLARCGAIAKTAVPTIVRVLANEEKGALDPLRRSKSADRRRRIAAALGRMGSDAAAAVPALTALRDKGDETIRVTAAQALRRMKAKK